MYKFSILFMFIHLFILVFNGTTIRIDFLKSLLSKTLRSNFFLKQEEAHKEKLHNNVKQ